MDKIWSRDTKVATESVHKDRGK